MNIEHLMTDPHMVLNSGLMNSGLMDAGLMDALLVTSDGWSLKEAFGGSSFEPGDLLTDYGRVLSAAMCRDALWGGGRQTW